MFIKTQSQPAPVRPDLRLVSRKAARNTESNAMPIGFTHRELRRLVADMID